MKTTSTQKRKNIPLNREQRMREGTKIWASFYRTVKTCIDSLTTSLME